MRRKWTTELVAEITQMRDSGKSFVEIEKEVGVPYPTIYRWLSKRDKNFSVGRKRIFEENDIESIIRLYHENKTLQFIGEIYKCSKTTIKRILIENNVSIRTSGEALTGKALSKEYSRNISKALKGRKMSIEGLEKLRRHAEARKVVLDKEQLDDIILMYSKGESLGGISRKYGYSKATIKRILEENGIVLRTHGESVSSATKGKKKRFYHRVFSEQQKRNISKALCGRKIPVEVTNKVARTIHAKHIAKLRDIGLSLTDKEFYYKRVWALTEESYRSHRDIINPGNMPRGRYEYHIDHVYSIADGFRNGISPEIISHPCNLRTIPMIDNCTKRERSDTSIEGLLLLIEQFGNRGEKNA